MNIIKLENHELRLILTLLYNSWSINKVVNARVVYETIQSQIKTRGVKNEERNTNYF